MSQKFLQGLLLGCAFSAINISMPAAAAQNGEATKAGVEPSWSDDIVVTARRREESLQTVPVAV